MIASAIALIFIAASRSQFRGSVISILILILLNFGYTMSDGNNKDFSLAWGEGSTMDMHGGRVDASASTKHHVEELKLTYESCQSRRNRRRLFKRSFQRAQRRASTHGYTLYHGQWMTAKQLGTEYRGPSPDTPPSQNVTVNPGQKRKRLTMMSWNASGLRPADWDWLQIWLGQQRLDVIALQETHWPFSGEWQQPDYYCLHSGNNGRSAGVMTLISKRLCKPTELSWDEPVPGRLLHVRIHGTSRGIDIINGYQHVHAPARSWVFVRWHGERLPVSSGLTSQKCVAVGQRQPCKSALAFCFSTTSSSWTLTSLRGWHPLSSLACTVR